MKLSNSQPIVLWVLMLAMALLVGCRPTPRGRTAAVLNDVETYINEHPDSALAVLRQLNSADAPRGAAQRARLALLHSMALDKCYIDLQTDSILAPAVSYYARHGSPDEKLRTQYYLGRLQYNAGEYQEAIITYTEALTLTDQASDFKYIGFVNQAIADTYAATYQESESFPYLDRAYDAFLQVPDSVLAKKTLYKKALALSDQQYWIQADSLFSLVLSSLNGLEDISYRIKANYALHLVNRDFSYAAEAAGFFEESFSERGTLPTANHWAAYAFCLARNGEKVQAQSLFQQLSETFPADKRVLFWRSLVNADGGNYKEALSDYQEVVSYQDSIGRIQLNHSTLAAQKKLFEHHALLAQHAARRRAQLLWEFTFFSFLIVGLILTILRRRIWRQQKDNARLQQMIEAVDRQLACVGEEQTALKQQFGILFQDYFSTLGKICADYKEGQLDKNQVSDRAVLRRLDLIIRDFTGKGGDHEEFERLLDKHLNHVMSDFRRDFPKMRTQAYYLVGYIFAGLDMQTISVLMGVDVDALYARKHRIKAEISKSSSPRESRYLELFH